MYILDGRLEPLPIGVAGELYIGGTPVGQGYLNRPELTAERFIPDPFGFAPGGRLYRTGDIARYRVDGAIEFLGRADHQEKIRGYRIEPGEIEVVIRQHPAVADAAVVTHEVSPGDKRLIAYVVAKPGAGKVTEALAPHLAARLPDYMLPSAILLLDALPLLPSGKLDRRALPAPGELGGSTVPFVAPRTPLEVEVARLMGEVLRRERVGVHDNFFEIGGHSLMATRLVSRVLKHWGVNLPLRQFFERPTVEAVALAIGARAETASMPALVPTREALPDVAQLSDAEVAAMLEKLQGSP
jgi:hypothetical protein